MEYSLEQLNYFRICYVGFNLVPVGLRQIFRNEWDFRYKTTPLGEWKDTPQNGCNFYNNESRRSRTKNARYLATIQNGNTAEWDCSCLFFAILYSDSIGTTLSPAVSKDIDDLRQVRNDLAHISEAEVTDADFYNYVGRVLYAFTSLGLPITDIEDVKNQTSFPTKEVENMKKEICDLNTEMDQIKSDLETTKTKLQSTEAENRTLTQEINLKLEPFCIVTLAPPHEVIRRSKDIERITNKMQELHNGANGSVSTIYLSGNPGCGKSQLARQLGHEFFSTRPDNAEDWTFVATLNAESIETLADSYISLGRHLGITEYTLTSLETSKRDKPGETIQRLQRLILPKIRKYLTWMIIADDVVDITLVRHFLPQTGSKEWGHGQVLITTQDSTAVPHNAPHTYHESFSKGMLPDDAVELLEKVSQISDRKQAETVAKVLDYQPLGLAAAASYVQTVVKNGSPNYSWTEYLEGLTHRQREATEGLLASESLAYSKTTTTAVKMALQRAVEADEVLCRTFSFWALCASEVLPLEAVVKFVRDRITDQPEELIKAKILRSSLILVSAEEKEDRLYLGLHNIVHAVLKQGAICKLESSEKYQSMAEAVKIFGSLLELNKENYALLNKLAPHCKFLLQHMTSRFTSNECECTFMKKLTPFITVDEFVKWLGYLADACRNLSDLSCAKHVVDLACGLLENIHHTDGGASLKAWVYNMSGVIYCDIGKHSQAKICYERALVINRGIYGEEHGDVAACLSNLGQVYSSLGEYNQAKELYERALTIEKKVFGEEHDHVATSLNNLGQVYYSIEEHNQAKELYLKALMIQKKIFGDENSHVALSYNNLAAVFTSTGEYSQAKELYLKALAIQKKIFGEDHAHVATSYGNLGHVYDRIGEYNQAKELNERALIIQKKIFGEDHDHVATSYGNLGTVYKSIGEYNKAKELYEKALKIQKKIFGEEHADVATSYNNLATVYYSIERYNQAKELYLKALEIQKKVFGEEHSIVATTYNNLALVYKSTGEYNEAKELYEKALMIQEKIFGEEHSDLITIFNNLALLNDCIAGSRKSSQRTDGEGTDHGGNKLRWRKITGPTYNSDTVRCCSCVIV